jgi:NAD(P)-dependent dehydrogenase (short-subunit alcohol dehydrogenase family)
MQEPKTVLITGANRGLGFEFVQQLSAKKYQIYCCCRDLSKCSELMILGKRFPYIKIFQVDITEVDAVAALVDELKQKPIDILIHNAGIYTKQQTASGQEVEYIGAAEISLSALQQSLATNAIAPLKLTEALIPNLCLGKDKKVVAISSIMGSIANNDSGGSVAYRMSKAALNAAMHTLALDCKELGLSVLLLHPGWVKTQMGTEAAPLTPAESVSGMLQVIERCSLADSGKFLDYQGEPVLW